MRSGGIELLNLDCLDLLKSLPDSSVNLILIDPPYGSTNFEWDKSPNYSSLFKEFFRVGVPNACIAVFSQQPYATDVINSCRKYFRYEIIWEKTLCMGFPNANKMPLRGHENILIFYKKLPTYNPQKYKVKSEKLGRMKNRSQVYKGYSNEVLTTYTDDGTRFPSSVIMVSNHNGGVIHPTQKPIALFRWLVRTYSNPGETVFDGYSGSGTTAEACIIEGRKFIGSELNKEYYDKSIERLSITLSKPEFVFPNWYSHERGGI